MSAKDLKSDLPEAALPETAVKVDAEKLEDDTRGVTTLELYKPIKLNGKMTTQVTLDFDSLTGADMDNIDRALGGASFAMPILSQKRCLYIAAKAAGLQYEDLLLLNIKDATRLVNHVINFTS